MSPKYLSDIIPSTTRWYAWRSANNIPLVKVNNNFFINTFFPSTLTEWNKLYTRIRSSTSLNILNGRFLQFVKPLENSLYTCHNPIRIKYFTRLRLRYQKFKHGFPDAVDLLCKYSTAIENTVQYFLHCLIFSSARHAFSLKIQVLTDQLLTKTKSNYSDFLLW